MMQLRPEDSSARYLGCRASLLAFLSFFAPDWRGWIGVAWVVFWGSAYAFMAIQAKAPQVWSWMMTLARGALPA